MNTALMAFLHHLLAFTLVACVVYEFIAYRQDMSVEEARRIQRADLMYGISAGLLLMPCTRAQMTSAINKESGCTSPTCVFHIS